MISLNVIFANDISPEIIIGDSIVLIFLQQISQIQPHLYIDCRC